MNRYPKVLQKNYFCEVRRPLRPARPSVSVRQMPRCDVPFQTKSRPRHFFWSHRRRTQDMYGETVDLGGDHKSVVLVAAGLSKTGGVGRPFLVADLKQVGAFSWTSRQAGVERRCGALGGCFPATLSGTLLHMRADKSHRHGPFASSCGELVRSNPGPVVLGSEDGGLK